MLASRWNQHRMRMEAGKHTSIAFTRPGAPSEVIVVGIRSPRLSIERKNSVQQASDSLFPTARCSRCLRPSAAMPQPTSSASLAPCRRSDSKTASTNRYSTSMPDRSRLMKALIVLPQPVGDLADRGLGDQQLPGGIPEGVLHVPGGQATGIHFVDQRLQHLAVAVQEAHQARPERLAGTADL